MNSNSEKRRVLLRADAGGQIGFGHFIRTVALAAYLKDVFLPVVVSRNPDLGHPSEYQRYVARRAGVRMPDIEGRELEEFNRSFLQIVQDEDIVVLDNYYYTTEYQTEVRRAARSLVCIDDVHDRHFTADLLITFCPLQASDFSMEPYTRFRGGIEWSFLREPFLRPIDPKRRIFSSYLNRNDRETRIVLAMGGADPLRLTDKFVPILRRVRPDCRLDILAGDTVRLSFRPDPKTRVWRNADAETIVRIFDEADVGIFPASTVCVEAFARQLPVIAGYYVDNQVEFFNYGVDHNWFQPLCSFLAPEQQLEQSLAKILGCSFSSAPDFDFPARKQDIIELFKTL